MTSAPRPTGLGSSLGPWGCTLMALHAPFALAQSNRPVPATTPAAVTVPSIEVVGQRASLATAQSIKKDALEVVDAVVADDIQKLPDLSVSEALQRITGVQMARDRGDGTGITIRGLLQVETLLNGREVFTAGNGRVLNFADFSSELVSSLQVYKSSSAEHLEGGIGGLVDLRTRRPFDFAGRVVALTARVTHGDLVHKDGEQVSALFSDRWQLGSAGRFGALLSLSHQRRFWREDQKSSGTPTRRTNLVGEGLSAGQAVLAPSGTTETTSVGHRERDAANLVLQWHPSQALALYAEGSYAQFKTRQDSYQINVFTSSAAGQEAVLFPGTSDLQRITWTNAPLSILSFARDTVDRVKQFALGGSWRGQDLTLSADLSRTTSFNNLFFSGPVLSGTAAQLTQDVSGGVPATSLSGTPLLDPASLRYTSIAYRAVPFDGDLNAARVDATYAPQAGFIDSLSAGLRHARRGATNAPGLIFGDAAVSIPAANLPGTLIAKPYNDFLPGSTSLRDYLVGDLAQARDVATYRALFGITAPAPTAGNPLSVWTIAETTDAGYLMARFKAADQALEGNAGLRLVRTHESVDGWQTVTGSGVITPIAVDSRYTDVLPSANLRWTPTEGLVLRATASKTVTRPDFNQISPSMTLVRNTADPTGNGNIGTGGNPELRPIRASNVDVAIERYFGPASSVHGTVFWKKVDGFLATVISRELHEGVPYNVSRPQNSDPADIRGVELGYQQFFDFLPGWMSGLGLQANYTYVDSETPNSALGARVPLQNLSRHSANLIGMYERGPWSARLAYNWRDRFLVGIANVTGVGAMPIYTAAYGWLDASLRYRVNDTLSFAIEGANLLRTRRNAYFEVPTRPQSAWLNDRQLGATATLRF
ncbi:TonB-dependent receptor [Aquabacterium sp.]|uniref:TonB-dependent receptor n=1 Tax=Aquabacterium sp. TaxID=1872578 RepID=UPI002CFE7229|nr:TonB-dependent receptor [Aquabacterium sp.]HSW06002.1 TonB-dependent receptor [Aquabacterium sp.]